MLRISGTAGSRFKVLLSRRDWCRGRRPHRRRSGERDKPRITRQGSEDFMTLPSGRLSHSQARVSVVLGRFTVIETHLPPDYCANTGNRRVLPEGSYNYLVWKSGRVMFSHGCTVSYGYCLASAPGPPAFRRARTFRQKRRALMERAKMVQSV